MLNLTSCIRCICHMMSCFSNRYVSGNIVVNVIHLIIALHIITVNCQGLGSPEKRRDVLNYLKEKQFHIYCFQDTHFISELELYIQAQWGYKCVFNSYLSNSRGVAILFNNTFEYEIHKMKADHSSNFIILDITIEGERITLINIYGPNEDNPKFYENIFDHIELFQNEKFIICGDFNVALNQNLDTKNYLNINNPKTRDFILETFETFGFIVLFREFNPKLKRYTWTKIIQLNKQG